MSEPHKVSEVRGLDEMYTRHLVLIPNYFGFGKTVDEAWANVRKVSGQSVSKRRPGKNFVHYLVVEGTSVSEVDGGIGHPRALPPLMVDSSQPPRR